MSLYLLYVKLLCVRGTEFVFFRSTCRNAEEQKNQYSDHRNQGNQLHPAGFPGVMQTACSDPQGRAEDCQSKYSGKDLAHDGDQTQDKIDHKVDQNKLTESFSAASSFKAEIFFGDNGNVIIDDFLDIHNLSFQLMIWGVIVISASVRHRS